MNDEQKLKMLMSFFLSYFKEHLKTEVSYEFAFEQINLIVNGIRNDRIHDGTCAFIEDFGNMNTFINDRTFGAAFKTAKELAIWQVND